MNVLITGSNGQLGHELAKNLSDGFTELGPIPEVLQGAQVVCVDVEEMDITNYDAVVDLVEELNLDLIINCAAYTNVNKCETDSDAAFRVNALGARNLAMAAERFGAKLVHVSTDYVFSGEDREPRTEWDLCNPQSVYGKTKYLGEQYVRDFCSRYFIVRTSWLYGYVGNNFVKTILRLARENGAAKVVNDQFGNPTNAADLAHHILKLAATEQYGVYHCTGSGECSWYDFASKIVEYAGIPATVTPCTTDEYPTPAKRPAYSALDHRMLRNTVGDEMRPWQEALKYFLDHYEG
ncbi:MAG: dTDP-4-dehydrorhamnose reductase [Oscillospiraceae bacterium]|jgi:dTDP-4-dehydrorhamnose reductase